MSTTEAHVAKILIVEDEPNMVSGLRDNFEFEGYDVITAQDGVSGLSRALDESPDLVLLDVMMPRMSGLDVCRQLKSKRPSMPVIMLTARGQEVDKVVGLELGAGRGPGDVWFPGADRPVSRRREQQRWFGLLDAHSVVWPDVLPNQQ